MVRAAWIVVGSLVLGGTTATAGLWDDLRGALGGAQEAVTSGTSSGGEFSADELARGLREALTVGAERAVQRASAAGGFLADPKIRIPLPERLQTAGNLLRKLGFGDQVTSFEESMNRAAETASGKALPILGEAAAQLTFDDVRRIWKGSDDAATVYLEGKTRGQLYTEFLPIVHEAAQQVGVTRAYESLVGRPEVAAFVAGGDLDLDHYVTDRALDGLFVLLGEEEKRIRTAPVARTTDLLKRIFASAGVSGK